MLYAVIPAGGSGTRLWPLSRAGHPKFLHALTGSPSSLLQATYERLRPLATAERTMVVTGVAHAAAVARQLPSLPADNILVEPSPRDSCPAIALAAAVIATRDRDAIMGSFAADHLVHDDDGFRDVVHQAMVGAQDGLLMTFGIVPTHPETGYGYVQCGEQIGAGALRRVQRFKEKPNRADAVSYVESGQYLWNASMFIWRVDVFLRELAEQQPELASGVQTIARAWDTPAREEVIGEVWPHLPKISVDYAVMEGAAAKRLVGTVPSSFGWNDVGDFHTLGDVLPSDEAGNVVVDSPESGDKPAVLLRDTQRTVVVPHGGRLIAALGVSDLVIVDTKDALLVCPRSAAQDIKSLVEQLRERGDTQYI